MEYIYANGKRIASFSNGDLHFIAQDQVMSATALLDEDGTVDQAREYWPYGESWNNAIGYLSDYQFAGKIQDGTGLYYFGARYYRSEAEIPRCFRDDPALGRFLSVDPKADKYPSLTPYQYAANNPLKFMDPTGKVIQIISQGDTVTYQPGMEYHGENEVIASYISSLNELSTVEIGEIVTDKLVGSHTVYKLLEGTGQGSKDAGGGYYTQSTTIKLMAKMINTGKVAHELFHAFQDEQGFYGSTVNAEVGAYLFQGAIEMNTVRGNSVGTMAFSGRGTTLAGENFYKAMYFLASSSTFSQSFYKAAVANFIQGSLANSTGLYDQFSVLNPTPAAPPISTLFPLGLP